MRLAARAVRELPVAAAMLLTLMLAGACRRGTAKVPKDALQEAFHDNGLSATEARGHRVFGQRCATCHGAEGRGDGQNAYNLDPPPPDFQESLAKLAPAERRKIVLGGTAAVGRSSLCPPRERSLDPDDIDAVLAWLDVAARKTPPQAAVTRSQRPAPR